MKIVKNILFSLVSFFSYSQFDFFFIEDELINVNISISEDWKKLNLVEAESFLKESGFFETETTRMGEQISVSGKKRLRGNAIHRRGILFLDKQATSYLDVIVSQFPCHSCVIDKLFENMPDDEIVNGVYNKQIKETKQKDLENKKKILSTYKANLSYYGFNKSPDENMISELEYTILNENLHNKNKAITYRKELSVKKREDLVLLQKSITAVVMSEKKYLISGTDINDISTYTLREMIDLFIEDCKEHGILLKDQIIEARFEKLEDKLIGKSYGMNNNDKIILKVDPVNWEKASKPKRWYILYHELGHDVLNLDHGEGGKMMFNFSDRGYSWDEFFDDKEEMFSIFIKYRN